MKIAIIGYGKMGKLVEQAALGHSHSIVAIVGKDKSNSEIEKLTQADVAIDFSRPDAAIDNLKLAAKAKVNLVTGTTGWYDKEEEAKKIVETSGIGFLYAPNFSLGVALFTKIIEEAAKLLSDYDVNGYEIHHNKKLDSPSGTAQALSKAIEEASDGKKKAAFASVRVGAVPGTHTVIFDSPADTITLTHTARNREGFAAGAVKAAEWLHGKKGFYTLKDMLR